MKSGITIAIISIMLSASFLGIVSTVQAQDPQQLWALIVCGSTEGTFSNDTQYMYHVLHDHYAFAGIYYLDVNTTRPGVNALSTRANVRSAITNWLRTHSTGNDIIFIYFSSHGGGYSTEWNHELPYAMEGGRFDASGDEGQEVRESTFREYCWLLNALYDLRDDDSPPWDRVRNLDADAYIEFDYDNDGTIDGQFDDLEDLDGDSLADDILMDPDRDDCCNIAIDADANHDGTLDNFFSDGEDTNLDRWIVGIDLNGNGNTNNWVGIDECAQLQDGSYWDDELASDLNTLSYAKLIFVKQGCLVGNLSCFSGGLIDDISANKRIIMSASSETSYSYGPEYDSYSYWSKAFIDALHGQETHYDTTSNSVVHENPPVYADADYDNDGYVSMWEAWEYAWYNDLARLAGLETPWLDDNFNDLPTYRNEADQLDSGGGLTSRDGLFSMETYFGFTNLKTSDINEDHIVDTLDATIIASAFGSEPGDPNWNPLADLNNDLVIDIIDMTFVGLAMDKYYSDPPIPVSTETIIFTHPTLQIVSNGETFSVNVVLFNVTDLRGWQFKIYWNNTVLSCTGVQIHIPDNWGENVFTAGMGIENNFNATHGRYSTMLVALYPAPSFNGSMILATLNFEATNPGFTILDLQETIMANNEANSIPHITIDSIVIVKKR
ncbi:MAG TPA: dockerin type I domain-containing protein [Candidatus Bathyarchaeia archaeon]